MELKKAAQLHRDWDGKACNHLFIVREYDLGIPKEKFYAACCTRIFTILH